MLFRTHAMMRPRASDVKAYPETVILVDAYAAASHLAAIHDSGPPDAARIKQWAGRIRVWAHRGKAQRHGTDGSGRTLYDLEELRELAGTPVDN